MKFVHVALILVIAVLVTACASQQVITEAPEQVPVTPAKPAPAKESVKESPKKEVPQAALVSKPAASSKFSQLRLGLPLIQVEKLLGRPTKQWTHPTNKASIAFYFGPDRWVIQYSYKGEGVLTFNSGGEQLLTQIEVNKAE
jgi:hypothetical protein